MSEKLDKSIEKRGLLSSLKARLIVSALLLILVLMPLIGVTLNDAFVQQAKSAAKNELSAYVYSVLAVAEIDNNQLMMPESLVENRFNVLHSGLYALVSTTRSKNDGVSDTAEEHRRIEAPNIIWYSDSFLGFKTPHDLPHPATGKSEFSEMAIDGDPYLIYSFSASFEQYGIAGDLSQPFPITIHIIKDRADFQRQLAQFTKQLWTWLIVLMALLVIVQMVWLLWTLKPLAKFTRELRDIEDGNSEQLSEIYPTELQVVARQLNALLNTEKNQRKRYRNSLSDLAHSLKTPLAIIQSQKELTHCSLEQISTINHIIGHQLKRAQSAAGASWHLGTKVNPVTDKLVRTLAKIYREPQIIIRQDVDEQAVFKGDEADLTEILGNLLDNACKAAVSEVLITVAATDKQLIISVEDDGKGISQEDQKKIFERGIRADSYQQGHGVGLAIVRDLIDSYNGQLYVSNSQKLGGAKFQFSFSSVAG